MNLNTAGELADYLAGFPRDTRIILSSDSEGNSYSPLADASEGMYAADSTWSGEIKMPRAWVEAQMAGPNPSGWSEEDFPPENAEPVIVLGPVN